jgi:hypothetical protein
MKIPRRHVADSGTSTVCIDRIISRQSADVRVAVIPEKYRADFLALLQDPVFTEEADATQLTVMISR